MLQVKSNSVEDIVKKCDICQCARQCRLPFYSSTSQTTDNFDLIHMNVWGPYKVPIYDRNKYFWTIVDDYTRMAWIYLLKMKSDACVFIPLFL